MASNSKIKIGLLVLTAVTFIGWATSAAYFKAYGLTVGSESVNVDLVANANTDDYVGSETCKACHEDQAKPFSHTAHGKLLDVPSWKGKVQGCESCHGPGAKHIEDPTVPGSIVSFKNKNAKDISDTCLACHSGKETHNNYRRGEHWRNDVGCTDCHSPHGNPLTNERAGSEMFIGTASVQSPGLTEVKMLKSSEPQLCMSCHTETKSQFSKPFHHRVLEGTMKCSDCHNPHGGFEAKQTRLAVGADTGCIKCHANKQGPFAFEHAPLKTEGCSSCHSPHGANNPKLLNRSSVRQLCLECHSVLTDEGPPNAPTFHNQANIRYRDCTVCHTAIHGSNANKDFLR